MLLARVQKYIETIELYKIKAEMTRPCCQRLQYVALLNALKEGLGKMEERVEHFKEMDLACVALLEEVEEALVLLQYAVLDTEEQSIGESWWFMLRCVSVSKWFEHSA